MNVAAAARLLQALAALPSAPVGPVLNCRSRDNDECFRLVDRITGKPLAGEPYRITTPGEIVEGFTDEEGLTVRVFTGERIQQVLFERLPRRFPFADYGAEEHGCL